MELLTPEVQVIADRLFEQASTVLASSYSEASGAQRNEPQMQLDEYEHFEGVEYEVVIEAVRIRLKPDASSVTVGIRPRGQIVKMFEFDESRSWRRVETGGDIDV